MLYVYKHTSASNLQVLKIIWIMYGKKDNSIMEFTQNFTLHSSDTLFTILEQAGYL